MLKKRKTIHCIIIMLFAFMLLTSCEEDSLTESLSDKTTLIDTMPSDTWLPEGRSGQTYPFPTILHQTFVPEYELFSHTKCLTWRVSWPQYANTYNSDLIPTAFSLKEGTLHSFNFLNNNSAGNTLKTSLSLYFDNKLESTINMWQQLNHTDISTIEIVYLKKFDASLNSIRYMVEERPELFEIYWETSNLNEMSYLQGDFFLFSLDDQDNTVEDLYGGVRIVSMSPRIIEVYLGVPNIEYKRPKSASNIFN